MSQTPDSDILVKRLCKLYRRWSLDAWRSWVWYFDWLEQQVPNIRVGAQDSSTFWLVWHSRAGSVRRDKHRQYFKYRSRYRPSALNTPATLRAAMRLRLDKCLVEHADGSDDCG